MILHQPMESVSGIGMEPKVILTSMSDAAIRQMLRDSLSQLPEAIGINNHQGSKATIDARTMDIVMNELHHRGLFFFDSHTNSTTAADKAAKTYGVPYVRNDLFVDNSASVSDICAMIQEGADRAKKRVRISSSATAVRTPLKPSARWYRSSRHRGSSSCTCRR